MSFLQIPNYITSLSIPNELCSTFGRTVHFSNRLSPSSSFIFLYIVFLTHSHFLYCAPFLHPLRMHVCQNIFAVLLFASFLLRFVRPDITKFKAPRLGERSLIEAAEQGSRGGVISSLLNGEDIA